MKEVYKDPQESKLNIVYVGTLPPHMGGSAISGSQLVIEFSKLGHKIRSIAAITAETQKTGDKFKECHPELNISRFLIAYFETSPNLHPSDEYRNIEKKAIQKNLVNLIDNEKPDIIIAGRETYAWHVPDIAIKYNIPCILRTAGSTTNGILNKTIPEKSAQKLLAQYNKFDLLISPAKHLEDSIKALGINKIITIINAVDTDQFLPKVKNNKILSALDINDTSFVVGHISNMKSIKRPFDIVDSAEIILKNHPHIIFLIIGDGIYLKDMKRRCSEKKIINNFRFTGWLDYESIPEYLNLTDVVVVPSSAEGLARVCLETQACGKCLIASDIPPSYEIIKDRETGLIFKLGDIKDLTSKVLIAFDDQVLRSYIGKNARERIHQHSIDHAALKYINVFKKVIQDYKRVNN